VPLPGAAAPRGAEPLEGKGLRALSGRAFSINDGSPLPGDAVTIFPGEGAVPE